MRRVETNFLIYELARKGINKPSIRFWSGMLMIIGLNLFLLNLILINSDLRPDMSEVYLKQEFYIPLGVLYLSSIFGCLVCYSLISPGKDMKFIFRFAKIAFYTFWWAIICILAYQVSLALYNGTFSLADFNIKEFKDYMIAFGVSFVILTWFVRKGYAIRMYRLIMVLCLTSFSFANVWNLFMFQQHFQDYDIMLVNIINIPVILLMCLGYKLVISKFKEKNKTYNPETVCE